MHPRIEKALKREWYPKPNDVIGGWCIISDPIKKSSNITESDWDQGIIEVGDFLSPEIAARICMLHNAALTREGLIE